MAEEDKRDGLSENNRDNKRADPGSAGSVRAVAPAEPDAATLLKKRARRRLIGAAALALFAAIVLPMVMDHQPAPPLKDIQVRIPSPDEGVTQRIASTPATPTQSVSKPISKPATAVTAEISKPGKTSDEKPAAKAETIAEDKQEAPAERFKVDNKADNKSEGKAEVAETASVAATSSVEGGQWEVQLGAYREAGRVKLLQMKLKQLGVQVFTEKVDTPNGPRTRVRAGPFKTQEAAEKARQRISKIIGVDGTVARQP